MSTVLLSIKPEYVEKIFNGTKKFEFRKFDFREHVEKIIIYATHPIMQIVGEADVGITYVGNHRAVWTMVSSISGIKESLFFAYFHGRKKAVAFELLNVIRYKEPKTLKQLGVTHAPQSFIYLPQSNTTTKL